MDMHELTRELKVRNDSKIVMLVADGLGGLPLEAGGKTELETARTPQSRRAGPPRRFGRKHPGQAGHHAGQRAGAPGAVRLRSAAIPHRPRGARGHRHRLRARSARRGRPRQLLHARRSGQHHRSPRRADLAAKQAHRWPIKLREVKIPGVEVFVEPVKEHRFVVVFRGDGLGGDVHDTDPQATGVPPLAPKAMDAASQRTAEVAAEFVAQGQKLLAGQKQANGLTLRGFSARPGPAVLSGGVRTEGRGDCRLSDVQGTGPAGGHGHRRQGPDAGRANRRAHRAVVELRFLLPPLQVHRQHRRGRQL